MSEKPTNLEKGVKRLISTVLAETLRPGIVQLGLKGGDYLRKRRLLNLASLDDKVDKVCIERGIPREKLRGLKIATGWPLLENASLQDDDEFQDRWANLLVSEMTDSTELGATFVEILKQLSRLDCEVLEYLVENGMGYAKDDATFLTVLLVHDDIQKAFEGKPLQFTIDKLGNRRCACRVLRLPLKSEGVGYSALAEDIQVTLIGVNLYNAASGKKPPGRLEQPADPVQQIHDLTSVIIPGNAIRMPRRRRMTVGMNRMMANASSKTPHARAEMC